MRRYKIFILEILVGVVSLLVPLSFAFADNCSDLYGPGYHDATYTGGSASTLSNFYNTIQKLELSKDGGITWFTVFDNNTNQVDLVALSGQNVGTILGSNNLPAGYYDKIRGAISASSTVFSVSCDNTHGLSSGSKTLDFTTVSGGPSFPITFTDDADFTVSEGGTTTCVMDFDAASSYSATFCHNNSTSDWQVYFPTFSFNPQIQGRK